MRTFRTTGLVFLSFLLLVTSWAFLLSLGAERTVLQEDYYHRLSDEINLPTWVHQQLLTSVEEWDDGPPEEVLPILRDALAFAVGPGWIAGVWEVMVEDAMAFAWGEQERLEAVIELPVQTVVDEFTHGLEALETGDEGLEDNGASPAAMAEELAEDLPDELSLAQVIPPKQQEAIRDNLATYRFYRSFLPYLVIAIIFGLYWLLAPGQRALKWFGTTAMSAGLLLIIAMQLANAIVFMPAINRASAEGELPLEESMLVDIMQYTLEQFTTPPLFFVVLGLAVFLTGTALSRGNKNDNQQVSNHPARN